MFVFNRRRILRSLANGASLKAKRSLDGQKYYALYRADNTLISRVGRRTVKRMVDRGLIYTNQKFPVSTFRLTERSAQ